MNNATMTEDALVQASQDLGREQDRIREQRRAIADELRRRHAAHAAARAVVGRVLDGTAHATRNEDGSVTIHVGCATTDTIAPGS